MAFGHDILIPGTRLVQTPGLLHLSFLRVGGARAAGSNNEYAKMRHWTLPEVTAREKIQYFVESRQARR
jgi:hypothetical protein